MRLAMLLDMDGCYNPTGVTRHGLAQLDRLSKRPGITLRLVSGRITQPDGRAHWEALDDLPRRELPLRTRDALRWWRMVSWPPIDWWTGRIDWVYSPAEYDLPPTRARRAVTSHDVLQDMRGRPPHQLERLRRTFAEADLILSVSHFNTARLMEHFPGNEGRIAYVPNAADDLFHEPATERERAGVAADLGLPKGLPYLLSVANFQPRKNLVRLARAVARLPQAAAGELGLVLVGAGNEAEERALREAIASEAATTRGKLVVRAPGYRQGKSLRAAYAGASALVFPSTCESFGIPAVEAMAQGVPVALADSTALPEIAGEAGWYFDPESVEAMSATIADLLARDAERDRRVAVGRAIARVYRWDASNDRLVEALASFLDMPRRASVRGAGSRA